MGAGGSKESKHYDEFVKTIPDQAGKTIAITGCTSGTGLVAAKCAASKGAIVLMLNRPSERAKLAEIAVKDAGSSTAIVETIDCDLQSFESVKAAAEKIISKYSKLDVLCNNAGVMALEDKATTDGYDVQMQTNHLSHFALTKQLFPLLKAAASDSEARIVNHSSMARKGEPLDEKYFGKNGGDLGGDSNSMFFNGARWKRYHQTKLANATFTAVLDEKLTAASSKVRVVVAAPGIAQTSLQETANASNGMSNSSMWIMRMAQSAEDGTMPLLHACFLDIKSGHLYEPKNGLTGLAFEKEVEAISKDVDQQKLLWEASEEACGKFDVTV